MDQIHKRFTTEQVKVLLKGYYQGMPDRAAVEEMLGIGKTRLFALLKQYQHDPGRLCLGYQRETPTRIAARVEKDLIGDSTLPIITYNYSAIRDRLAKHDIKIALSTIIG